MLPQLDFAELVPKPLDEVLEDPQALVRLQHLTAQLLTGLYNLEVYKCNELARRVDVEKRVTLLAGGFILLDYGVTSDYFQVFVEESANTTTIEIHHGEFLGIAPRITIPTGRYCQLPASSPRLLLRNSGAYSATIVAILSNRKLMVS